MINPSAQLVVFIEVQAGVFSTSHKCLRKQGIISIPNGMPDGFEFEKVADLVDAGGFVGEPVDG